MIMINVIYSLGYFRCFPSHLNLQKRGSIMNTANTSAQYYVIHAATELSLSDLYQAWQHLTPDEIIIDISVVVIPCLRPAGVGLKPVVLRNS